jgi:hypothetical protein
MQKSLNGMRGPTTLFINNGNRQTTQDLGPTDMHMDRLPRKMQWKQQSELQGNHKYRRQTRLASVHEGFIRRKTHLLHSGAAPKDVLQDKASKISCPKTQTYI